MLHSVPGGTLRARLLIGLLGVTGAGLLLTCVVGFLTLRTFITERLDAQLVLAAERAMVRLDNDIPPVGVDAPSSSPYIVVLLDPRTGEVRQVFGDAMREDVVLDRIDAMPLDELTAHAADAEIFDLEGGDTSVPPHRATVRLRPDAILVAGVPTNDREEYSWQLVLTQLITAALLLTGLALAGRWLIVRGLEPLSRMATTADRISTGSDLSARMPGSDSSSEAGRLAAAINTMLRRLEHAFDAQRASEQRVRAFAADASHELRTPLTTILGYAELYRQGAIPDAELPEAMGRVENEAARMSRLVAELLELARLDRVGSLQLGRADLAAVIRGMVDDARTLEPEREISLEAPAELWCDVDEARICQVVANLLGNVRDHTPPGTAARVRLEGREAEGVAVLRVSDEGPGMGEEDLRRAFDRFYRGNREPGGGSGLGLAIVHAIAVAHDGRVDIAAEPGGGTAVTVRFPLRQAAEE
ncbi:two-component system OmpR family sensor kinase [Nocardiopsis mwathae]|uniref:histidine kinase n=1 Tax=Nocardiopsis mwathae TaxID=1472723 RepID=A0A7W9YKL4_9ACTN|nr:HAMP domain-containing sensor histidine kinase [Nocardiopsis mwathae]MBB6173767.1 two-component system OmpR family sensor kinase [Nocardiopsis mwathae]